MTDLRRSAGSSLWLLLAVWIALGSGAVLSRWVGRDVATLASFAVATALVAGTSKAHGGRLSPTRGLLGIAAGFASYPAWAGLVAVVGLALGLAPRAPTAPGVASPALWLAVLVLAPIFEEGLYRGRLLPALRPRLGAPLAVVLASALFAAPHLEPWNVLGTFLVGLMLGTVCVATGSVALCVALHAGLNLACLSCGVPPVRLALDPLASAAAGTALLGLAIAAPPGRRPAIAGSRRSGSRTAARA